jgi:hypothetical protein
VGLACRSCSLDFVKWVLIDKGYATSPTLKVRQVLPSLRSFECLLSRRNDWITCVTASQLASTMSLVSYAAEGCVADTLDWLSCELELSPKGGTSRDPLLKAIGSSFPGISTERQLATVQLLVDKYRVLDSLSAEELGNVVDKASCCSSTDILRYLGGHVPSDVFVSVLVRVFPHQLLFCV